MIARATRLIRWGRRFGLEPLDLCFLALRFATLAAGFVWYATAADSTSAPQAPVLVVSLVFSTALYAFNAVRPGRIVTLYRIALVFDLAVIGLLVRITGGYASELHLAFILLIALHAYYFGIRTGALVIVLAAAVYGVAAGGPPPWPGFALRVAFFALTGICIGALAEQARWRRRTMERQQDQLLRFDRLATVGELAAGLAHELRNPLAGIAGALHVLRDQLANEAHVALVVDLQTQIDRMNGTLSDLLRHARPPRPQWREVDVNRLVDQSLQFVPHGGVEVIRRLDPSLPSLHVDPDLLHQALLNILVNARQAMTEGGQLTVETDRGHADGRWVDIRVSDTGPGIPPDHLDRVFQPFFTTKAHGTGLGLAIAARVVEQHGGRITVSSTIGRGTTFVISLPRTGTANGTRSDGHAHPADRR